MSFCSKCGQELTEGCAFCAKCGTPVNGNVKQADMSSGTLDRLALIPIVFALLSYAMPVMASVMRSVSGFEVFTDFGLVLPFSLTVLAGICASLKFHGVTMLFEFLAGTIYGVLVAFNLHEQNEYWHLGTGVYVCLFMIACAIILTVWRGLKVSKKK